jgi:ABC-2 type transport system permease protein
MAFTVDDGAPVGWIAGLAAASIVVALIVHARRELGASLLPERVGRPRALPGFSSPLALAWRLHWPTLVAWAGGSALFGLALGSLVRAIADANIDNPQIQRILQSLGHTAAADVGRVLLIAVFVIVAGVAGAAGVQAVLRLREEEAEGRLEALLATPRTRSAWLLSFTLVGALTVTAVLVAAGAAAALSFAVLDDPDDAWLSIGSAVAALPAVLSFVGVTALFAGLLPRAAIALGWGVYGVLAAIGMFGGLLGLDEDTVKALSPIANVPALPTDDWIPSIVLGAIAIAAVALGAVAFRRRDLAT